MPMTAAASIRLRLIQLPATPARGRYPTYALATAVQELVRRPFLAAKSAADAGAGAVDGGVVAPTPTLLSFTPQPTYTLGRRQDVATTLGAAGLKRLQTRLTLRTTTAADDKQKTFQFEPEVVATLRGGLTTYHGPGQAVLWPVLDLKAAALHWTWTVRTYSRLLETTTAEVLAQRFGVAAHTTDDPGLWVNGRKIAALGVHLRRNITALGMAVNLDTPVTQSGAPNSPTDDATNPWRRFVPCGLDGKGVTCVAEEQLQQRSPLAGTADGDINAASFAVEWAAVFSERLGMGADAVEVVDEDTVQHLMARGDAMLKESV